MINIHRWQCFNLGYSNDNKCQETNMLKNFQQLEVKLRVKYSKKIIYKPQKAKNG